MCDDLNRSRKPSLRRCKHGTYHLVIGNTTLHLSADSVRDLVRLTREAAAHFDDLGEDEGIQKPTPKHRFSDHLN